MPRLVDTLLGNTLAQQIYLALTEQILSGELAPGTRLKDNDVAVKFGTSNTPVREALRMLARDGLVEIQPYRGCVVRHPDPAEIAEIYDVRIALETYGAWVAAQRITEEQLDQLAELVDRHEDLISTEQQREAYDVAAAIHRLVLDAAGNRTLIRLVTELGAAIQITRFVHARHVRGRDSVLYQDILEALSDRDGERAASLMAEHIKYARDRVLEALQDLGSP